MDASAIQAIIDLAAQKFQTVEPTTGTIMVPKSTDLTSTEKYLPSPTRFRRTFSTRRFGDFIAYVSEHGTIESATFIAPDLSKVVAVLNHGSILEPHWGDNTAHLDLLHEPEFASFFKITRTPISQLDFIEYLEDWLPSPYVAAINANGDTITPKAAIAAARRVTLSTKTEATHQQEDMRTSRSALEEVEAKGAGDGLPYGLIFTGMVYHGLPQYSITARIGVRFTDKAPVFSLRLVSWESKLAEICEDAEDLIRKKLGDKCPVYVGSSQGNYPTR